MVRILFVVVYWSAFFLLRAFFRQYGLQVDPRIYNLAGGALFLTLITIYWLFSAFLTAHLSRAGKEAKQIAEANTKTVIPGEKPGNSSSVEKATGTNQSAKQEANGGKQSRVRVLRGNPDD